MIKVNKLEEKLQKQQKEIDFLRRRELIHFKSSYKMYKDIKILKQA